MRCRGGFNARLGLNMYWRARVTREAAGVIAPSEYIKREAVVNGIPASLVSVIPHFTLKNPSSEKSVPEDRRVLFVGRADPLKGIGEFLEALGLLRIRFRACIIAGGDTAKYEEMARRLGIEEETEFVGSLGHDDLDEYYRKSALLVFPSMSPESFGLVGIEAMSFGRPVVAFDSGGARQWLTHGETGLLVRRGDIEGLAASMERLLLDKALARTMGEKAMESVAANFRKESHLRALLGVYHEAIKSWQAHSGSKRSCRGGGRRP